MLAVSENGTRPVSQLAFVNATCSPFEAETCCPQNVYIATWCRSVKHVAITMLYLQTWSGWNASIFGTNYV